MAIDAAPEGDADGTAVPRKLSETLAHLQSAFADRAVPLREVIGVLQGRAYLLLLVCLALPFCTPIPLPGLSTPFGLVVAFIALRLTLGQKPFLPHRLLKTELPPGFFAKLLKFTQRIVGILEKFLRPRWLSLTDSEALRRLHALVILVSGLVLLLPLPIPLTNTFPAWVIILIACGLLERDGLFLLVGYVTFFLGTAYFFLLGETVHRLVDVLWRRLFS